MGNNNNDNNENSANPKGGKESSDTSSSQISHYFSNLVSRTLLWNQGASLFSRTSNNLYNLPTMKPALTPDMIPFTSVSPTAFAQRSVSDNEIKEGHDAVGHASSNKPNASYLKSKADRRKEKNSSIASSLHDNAVNLSSEYNSENNHEANSDKMSSYKNKADESGAVKDEETTSVSHARNTDEVPSNLSIENKTKPAEHSSSSSSSSSSIKISKVRQSEESSYSEIGPAKLTQASRIDKSGRPIDVTIHIGRIEVKAIQQVEAQRSAPSFPAASQMSSLAGQPKSTAPHMTLNDYLRKRAEGKY